MTRHPNKAPLKVFKAVDVAAPERRARNFSRCILFVVAVVVALVAAFVFMPLPGHQNNNTAAELLLDKIPALNISELIENSPGLAKVIPENLHNFTWEPPKSFKGQPIDTIGEKLRKEGFKPKHPVVFIPGVISTGLELWEGKPCIKKYFRQRLWGTFTMAEAVILKLKCWTEHMMLDPITGLDPPGIKLRPAQGMEAADYFVPGFFLFGRIIEVFGHVGYDNTMAQMFGYDWRLGFEAMHQRDRAMTRLRQMVELGREAAGGEKAVLIAHSMGSNLVLYFIHRMEREHPGWVDENIHAVVSLAGPWLGAVKAIAALQSGEMKDTTQLGPLAPLVEKILSRKERRDMFRSWGALGSLWPKGGNAVWGDDAILEFTPKGVAGLDMDTVTEMMFANATKEGWGNHSLAWSNSITKRTQYPVASRDCEMAEWLDPTKCALPKLPHVKFFCLYGVGKQTEKKYYYDTNLLAIDTNMSNETEHLHSGVVDDAGDGTVPLESLGVVPVGVWQHKAYNPGHAKVVTKEFEHKPVEIGIRGGPQSADHVDLLGNVDVLHDLVQIASGGADLQSRFFSDVQVRAAKIMLRLDQSTGKK